MKLFRRKNIQESSENVSHNAVTTRVVLDEGDPLSVSDFLLDKAEKENCTLYGIVDSARDDEVFRYFLTDKVKYKSLYDGTMDIKSYGVSGFMLECKKESPLFGWMTTKTWGNSSCIFFTSEAPFEELLKHFQGFNRVYLEDDDVVLFRYYDPRVLRIYLPTCTRKEINKFFGELESIYLEDDDPGFINKYSRLNESSGEDFSITKNKVSNN